MTRQERLNALRQLDPCIKHMMLCFIIGFAPEVFDVALADAHADGLRRAASGPPRNTQWATPHGCRFPWCVADHTMPGWARVHSSAPVEVSGVTVLAMFSDDPEPLPDPDEPLNAFVRLAFEGGSAYELRPRQTADMADMLAELDVSDRDQFVEALRAAAANLGVDQ